MSASRRLPYPGLRAYSRDETDLFFGREGCVNEMVDRLAAFHFLAVLGASGSGKSSLVRTGLLDALELGLHASAGSLWFVADCHPGGTPLRNLAAALLRAEPDADPAPLAIDALDAFLRRGPRSIVQWVDDGNLPEDGNLLVLVDQFEELFRYGDYAGREEAEAFAALLLESVRSKSRIHVVVTMRSEYLGACALIPGLVEVINSTLYLTRRMTREECRQAIEGPAAVVGFDIEPQLVSRLLNDLSSLAPWEADREKSQLQRLSRQADQLPLMQHALSRLWELARRRGDSTRPLLTLQDYLDVGQLQGALDQHAGEIVDRLSDAARPLVRSVFRALVSGATLSDAVRRPTSKADLVAIVGADKALVEEVINAFRARDCHFLRPSDSHPLTDDTVIDISHESLIRQWGDLAEWFKEEAQSDALWARLNYNEEQHGAGRGELLNGLDLANALAWWEREKPTEGWAAHHGGRFEAVEAYLLRSREEDERADRKEREQAAHERQSLRRRNGIYASLAVVCLITAGFAVYSYLQADHALTDARAANERTLAAADHFVVGFAERLRVTPGISGDEVRKRLDEGRAYLDKLADNAQAKRSVESVRARFSVIAALTLLDRGQPEAALAQATDAENILMSNVADQRWTETEIMERLDIYRTAAQALDDLERYSEADAKARQAVAIADALDLPNVEQVMLERAKSHFQLSYTLDDEKKYTEELSDAKQCIDDLSEINSSELLDKYYYLGRCYTIMSVAAYHMKMEHESDEYSAAALQAFEQIPADAKTVPMLLSESNILKNIGINNMDEKDYNKAREKFVKSEEILLMSEIDIRQRPTLRAALVDREDRIGKSFSSNKEYDTAIPWFEKAIKAGFIDDSWRNDAATIDNIDTALVDLSLSLGEMSWLTDPDLLLKVEQVHRNRLLTLGLLIKDNKASWCEGCELIEKEIQLSALIRFDRVRHEDRYTDAMALADDIIASAKGILAGQSSERRAVNARRAWYWTVEQGLIDSPDAMPSVTIPAEQIDRLNTARTRLEEFLIAYPAAWLAKRQLGRVNTSLAKIYAKLGRREEAVAAAGAGAKSFDKDSIELLENWYRTGSGPVEQDISKANNFRSILSSRNWNTKQFTFEATAQWSGENGKTDYTFYIEDPESKDDDLMGRLIFQAETIHGVRLPDRIKNGFTELLRIARENNVSFVDLWTYALGITADSSGQVLSSLRNSFKNNETTEAADELVQQFERTGGSSEIRDALAKLFEGAPDRDFSVFLRTIAEQTSKAGKFRLTEIILDVLLSRANLDAARMADLYRLRSVARDALNETAGAESDLSIALSLKPGDPQLLNSLGYSWVEHDRNLRSAIELLERAVRGAPSDPLIRDNLGWAYVKSGSTEKGLALLQSAAAERPKAADILAHLGDAYRRLGRKDDAVKTLGRAAALATNETLIADIHRQQALLGPKIGPGPSAESAFVAAARLLSAADKSGRVGISTDDIGVAIRGFDPVSYFQSGEPELGSIDFTTIWHGALWVFANPDHLKAFVAQPEKYAPAYGGFCAYCVAVGHKVHADPQEWSIYNDKLYFHSGSSARQTWLENPEKYLEDSRRLWPNLEGKSVDPERRSPFSDRIDQAMKVPQ